MHRKALEDELQGTMSSKLASIEQLQQEQGKLLEEQLAEMREQQRMAQDLLEGDTESNHDSPKPLRPPTFYLDRDIYEVCMHTITYFYPATS